MTLLCVPILADDPAIARRDAILAAEKGADIVEYRVDLLMELEEPLESRIDRIKALVADSPLPCILTCRPEWEGGLYTGPEDERVSMFEALGTADHPPAYIDVELKAYTASPNIRQKINLAVDHPKQQRAVRTRLILSTHDFQSRPADLTRRILAMHDEPACAIVKIAYRARSIRDNLELFDILAERQKPTIALAMGEHGLMSRVLAPKFGAFLTFASLRDESATAPGQPTIDDLLNLYRFRSIKPTTKVYGVIGWPVAQSMSPLIHNAGFESIGFDGVYLPLPIAADPNDPESTAISLRATFAALVTHGALNFAGASVTVPHKELILQDSALEDIGPWNIYDIGAANTLHRHAYDPNRPDEHLWQAANTDAAAISTLLDDEFGSIRDKRIAIIGAGGAARAAAYVSATRGARVTIYNRNADRAKSLAASLNKLDLDQEITAAASDTLPTSHADLYINCTPLGMTAGPDPDALAIPIPDMPNLSPDTVFFDTVYNPPETPMLREARARGYRTIDGVQMFVKQAAAQFQLWTNHPAPTDLFDRLVRQRLAH
ncbi:MAG: type I 3-dehydroquinate dehydratase [Planctomycetota bacterium]|nr:MAG: type I 3-dehydroquinate dehydratase [Planctomycetota bacterium]